MCGMCESGVPHTCFGGIWQQGRGVMAGRTYREEGPSFSFFGQDLNDSRVRLDADMDEDPKDPPYDGLSIRSGHHRITTAGYLPGNTSLADTTNDVSLEDLSQIDALVDNMSPSLIT